jgi:L-ribulose-5-phosphate 4-epimerase
MIWTSSRLIREADVDTSGEAKKQIVEAAQELTRKGFLMATGGNLSLRLAGQSAFAITPSDYDYLKMVPDDVCLLDFELNRLEGARKPSVETSMHGAIYQARPDVNAIVHTHQVYASALSRPASWGAAWISFRMRPPAPASSRTRSPGM